jgi:zinc/manganese transport system substrate-binding protein
MKTARARHSLVLPVALALGVLTAPRPAEALRVVAGTEDVGSLAREVVGPDGEVTTLANPHQDPHFVDARPSLLLPMARADALVVVGLDLEVGWLPLLVKNSRNASIQLGAPGYVDASTFIQPQDVATTPVDRSMGDIHPRGDPHYLKDPRNGVLVVRGLGRAFSALDPARAARYVDRAEAYATALEARIRAWEARLAPLRGRGAVSYHKSFNYLFRWLGVETVSYVEPKPGVPPSPAHVMQLVMLARARKVQLFISEDWYPTSTSEVVAQKSGSRLTVVPGLPDAGERYADHVEEVVVLLERAAGLGVPAPAP